MSEAHREDDMTEMQLLEPHPLSRGFPDLSPAQQIALESDIAENGLIEPIVLLGKDILDGRHRYAACVRLGIPPVLQQYEDTDAGRRGTAPEVYVLSKNYYRRHLTPYEQKLVITEQKRHAAEILVHTPSRTDRSVAREVGFRSPHTIARVRDELEDPESELAKHVANVHDAHSDEDEPLVETVPTEEWVSGTVEVEGGEVVVTKRGRGRPRTVDRVEDSGKKQRGRKPTALTIKANRQERQSKSRSLDRDEQVNALVEFLKRDPDRNTESLVLAMSGFDGMFQTKITVERRGEFVERFAKTMGRGITLL